MKSRPIFALVLAVSPLVPRLRAQSALELARAAYQRGQVDSAYDLAQRATDAEPLNAATWAFLGDVACEKAGRSGGLGALFPARKCKSAYGRALALAPDSVRYMESLAAFLSQAPGIAGGDKDSAQRLIAAIRRRDDARADLLEANLLWSGNAAAKARADSMVERVAAAHPADRLVQLRVAGWWTGTNRPEQALEAYEALAARDTTDAVARFYVGRQLVLLKRDLGRAAAHLRFAAAAPVPPPPTFTPGAPWYRLGQVFVQQGMPDSARLCFERALRINPQLQVARLSLDSLPRP